MEYLMTYGWAIIAVILGVFFQLGIFNAGSFGPRISPGACQVARVGTGITQTISLTGECQGGNPQFVSLFNNPNGNVLVPGSSSLYVLPQSTGFSFSVWFEVTSSASLSQAVIFSTTLGPNNGCGYKLDFPSSTKIRISDGCAGGSGANAITTSSFTFQPNTWYNVAWYVGPGGVPTGNILIDGVNYAATFGSAWDSATGWTYFNIGAGFLTNTQFPSYVANLQIYNTSLSTAELQALYLEGIGGAPVRPQNLIGWWPLNGNPNDYSGLGNNGQTNPGASYTNQWLSGYTQP